MGEETRTQSLLMSKVSGTSVTGNMRSSAGTRAPVLHVYLLKLWDYTEEQTPPTRKEAKKAYSLLTCDLRDKTAALCAYRGGSNTLYDCIILHGSSSPLHPMVDTGSPRSGTGRPASLIHSPPRCLCQVIAGGKRKTDQYISHGTDR